MKKVKLLVLLAAVAVGTVFFQSCGDNGDNPNLPPSLNFLGGVEFISTDVTLGVGAKFKIGITATCEQDIKSFKISLSVAGVPGLPLLDSTFKSMNFNYVLSDSAADAVGVTKKYTFTVTDKDGLETVKSITVNSKAVDLIELTQDVGGNPFRVWNVKGPKSGAFDLLNGNNLTVNDPSADKDIVDSTANTELSAWPARWVSLNTTKFKKVPTSIKYGTVTTPADLDNAWANSGAEMQLYKGIKKDDVFIFKLRNDASKLVLVGITEVVTTSGDNNDNIKFSFKKKP